VRQWVLSLPFELRGLAATKPDVLTALGRIFAEEVERVTKRLAGVAGLPYAAPLAMAARLRSHRRPARPLPEALMDDPLSSASRYAGRAGGGPRPPLRSRRRRVS